MLIFVNNNEKLPQRLRRSHRWKLFEGKSNFTRDKTRRSPGDRRNIEKTIIDKTAEITSSAMQIPRQFLFSVDDIAISCKQKKGKRMKNFLFAEAKS